MPEIKPIIHTPGYFVGEDGTVYSEKYGRRCELKPGQHKGYRRVILSTNNKRQNYPVHRLVAEAFIPNPEEKPFVNHLNGNKADNNVSNLEWVTGKENAQHAYDVLAIRNGKTGYSTKLLYPNQELRNKLVSLGIPRCKHNLAELGEMLPVNFTAYKHATGWDVHFGGGNPALRHWESGDTEADARAKMLIYLLEHNILKAEEVG